MYWKLPDGNVTGYVIYYQSKGGLVISDTVIGAETETHSLDGLQRGVTYYISIVALSEFLPSPLVGPYIIQSKSLLYTLSNIIISSNLQLQQNPQILLPLYYSTTIHISMSLCLGSHQMTTLPLAISSTMNMIIWKNR